MAELLSRLRKDARRLLISDFDGTITERDFFECARPHLPLDVPDYWADYLAGKRTHFNTLQGIFGELRGGVTAIADIAQQTEPDPGLPDAVAQLRSNGWEIVVVSAGCEWYIRHLLDRLQVDLCVISNPGEIADDGGLHMVLPVDSPFFSPEVGVDKPAVVRWALEQFEQVAFAGDGRPDERPARLVPDDLRFARGWLAERFTQDQTPFHPFRRWTDVAHALLEK